MSDARRLPPLTALRAFEAAARHGSFTRAAGELGMTQAAVSYQIKILEERLGGPLFLRRPREVLLTEAGRRLAPPLTGAFEMMAAAFAEAAGNNDNMLSISTVPTFATNWLAPRLGSFQLANPDLAVRLETANKYVVFGRDEFDVAIRVGDGDWPGLVKHRLMPVTFTPMLSPDLAERAGGIKAPADLLEQTVIGADDRWWPQWLAAAGLPANSLDKRSKSDLGTQGNEARAAIAGQGVALLTPAFFSMELESGRLLQPFDIVCTDGDSIWLVYPFARRNVPKIVAFRNWLMSEASGGAD